MRCTVEKGGYVFFILEIWKVWHVCAFCRHESMVLKSQFAAATFTFHLGYDSASFVLVATKIFAKCSLQNNSSSLRLEGVHRWTTLSRFHTDFQLNLSSDLNLGNYTAYICSDIKQYITLLLYVLAHVPMEGECPQSLFTNFIPVLSSVFLHLHYATCSL